MIVPSASSPRATTLYTAAMHDVQAKTDKLFVRLLVAQWLACILVAGVRSPYTWNGSTPELHAHVIAAVVLGGIVTIAPLLLVRASAGATLTRHVVAVAQMCWSALIIHLTDGRIESHFHVFGSLAFLAFYRDTKVLLTAVATVTFDHLIRGYLAPASVYGLVHPEWWRFIEHATWVTFESAVLVVGIRQSKREMRLLSRRQADVEMATESVEAKIAERTHDLNASREQYRQIVECTHAIPFELDVTLGYFAYLGPRAFATLAVSEEACAHGGFLDHFLPRARYAALRAELDGCAEGEFEQECTLLGADGRNVDVKIVARADSAHGTTRLRGLMLDVTEQRRLMRELSQSQKLESVGRLAAGVAHEINTPVQYVTDSLHFLKDATADLITTIHAYRGLRSALSEGGSTEPAITRVDHVEATGDIDYVIENAPPALARALDGLARVTKIVRSMKEFAHPDRNARAPTDINRAVESTITIATNEYKLVADVVTDLGELPIVDCFAGELNQVVLNLIVNAAHAIGDRVRDTAERGVIRVITRDVGDFVEISVADTGTGIPIEARACVFDPFFTTKEVGRGTGQGLAIARSVLEKHGGSIWFETELGVGTTFFVRLPKSSAGRGHDSEMAA